MHTPHIAQGPNPRTATQRASQHPQQSARLPSTHSRAPDSAAPTSVDGQPLEDGLRLQGSQVGLGHVWQHHILLHSQAHSAVAVPAQQAGRQWGGRGRGRTH